MMPMPSSAVSHIQMQCDDMPGASYHILDGKVLHQDASGERTRSQAQSIDALLLSKESPALERGHDSVIGQAPARPCVDLNSASGKMARWYANQNARPTPVDNALDNPKPVNALDQYGPIALQRAVCRRDTAAVAELVKNKSIELNTVVPRTPLHRLVSEPISEPVFQGATPLSEAVENRNYAIVELLIEAGGGKHRLRPTSHPMYFPSPILNAANYDDQPWLDPNIPNARGMPPLLIAAKNDDIRMIKLLLSIDGINRNACDANRFHPIHYAAFAGNKTMVQALVGGTQSPLADVNAQTSTGETAISFATGREKVGVVEYLLNVSGINPHLTRGSGKMPRQLRIFFSSPAS